MDQVYRLIVDLSTRGQLDNQIGRIGKAGEAIEGNLGRIGKSVGSIGSGLADAFTGAVERSAQVVENMAKIGGGAFAAAVGYGVKLNSELEKTQISLSGIFEAQLGGGLTANFRKAGDVMATMRKDAADLPGEFKDLVNIFRFSATPGFQAGASVEQLEKLSAKAMAASAALGVPMEQAAREMGMLLQGRAGAHNVLGNLLGLTGDKASEFNKGTGADRIKTLETEFNKYGQLNELFATSFDALSSTMLDNAKRFLGASTSGLFDRVKIAMQDANSWFDKNQGSIMAFADKVSEKLGYAFDVGRDKITEWWPTLRLFVEHAEQRIVGIWEKVEPLLARLEPKVKAALGGDAFFDHIETVLKAYGAVKLGSAVLPQAASLASSLGGGGGALGGIGIEALGTAAAAAAPLIIAAAGAIDILTDSGNVLHDFAVSQLGDMQFRFGQTIDNFGHVWDRVSPPLLQVADVAGGVLLYSLDTTAMLLENFSIALDKVSSAGSAVIGFLNDLQVKLGIISGLDHNDDSSILVTGREPLEVGARNVGFFADALAQADEKSKTKRGAGGGGGGTTIGHVEITIVETTDPSRLARLTVEELKKLSERSTRSPSSFTPMRRGYL